MALFLTNSRSFHLEIGIGLGNISTLATFSPAMRLPSSTYSFPFRFGDEVEGGLPPTTDKAAQIV